MLTITLQTAHYCTTKRIASMRDIVAMAFRVLLAVSLILWAASIQRSAAYGRGQLQSMPAVRSAKSSTQAIVQLSAQPVALADDAQTGRVFAMTTSPDDQGNARVVTLRATDGKVLASKALSAPNPHAPTAGGKRLPADVYCPGCIAVDEQSGRVFALTRGLIGRSSSLVGSGLVFMLDAATGRVLATTALSPNDPTQPDLSAILVVEHTNRVFSASGPNNRLSVLDATTGKLLHTVAFPNHASVDPVSVLPLGVDSHDGLVLVEASDGLALVDERTGTLVRAIHLPHGQGFPTITVGKVDGQRGLAVISVDEERDDDTIYSVESVNLAGGRVVGALRVRPLAAEVLTLDQRSGRAVLFNTPYNLNSFGPATLTIMDDVTGRVVGKRIVVAKTGGYDTEAAATINPLTGHALVLVAVDNFVGPQHLVVVDLHTGVKLRDIPVAGAPNHGQPGIVVDGPTRHVFVTNASVNSVTMLDATKL